MKKNFFTKVFVILSFLTAFNVQLKAQEMVAGKKVITGTYKGESVKYIDGEIAIKLKVGFKKENINDLLLNVKAKVIQDFDEIGWGWIELPKNTDVLSTIKRITQYSEIEFAEPNFITHTDIKPNDPYFKGTTPATYRYQWGLFNVSQSPPMGTYDADIDATDAWDISTGSSDVIIAILDTGIPFLNGVLSHPDLNDQSKIILGPDYIDLPGTPTYQEGVRDRYGHGTHVAGIASAETNNGTGVAGVAWNCKLMIIQVFDQFGNGTFQAFYNGVKYAVDYYINNPSKRVVINYSGGGSASQVELDAVIYANNHGVNIVASTGNDNSYIIGLLLTHRHIVMLLL